MLLASEVSTTTNLLRIETPQLDLKLGSRFSFTTNPSVETPNDQATLSIDDTTRVFNYC